MSAKSNFLLIEFLVFACSGDRVERGDGGFIRRGDGGRDRDEKSNWRRNDDRQPDQFRNRDQGARSDDRNRAPAEGNWRAANKPRDDDRKDRPKQEKGGAYIEFLYVEKSVECLGNY